MMQDTANRQTADRIMDGTSSGAIDEGALTKGQLRKLIVDSLCVSSSTI